MLSFYQQQRLFLDNEQKFNAFNLEKPLWIFVGSKVNAVRTERGRKVSDVIDILLFLQNFIKNEETSIRALDLLWSGTPGLIDQYNREIFRNQFSYLIRRGVNGRDLYIDILKTLFNNSIPGADLHVDRLKGVDGELGLRVGNNDYFGVINVGDETKLLKLCDENGLLVSERDFSDSLFAALNNRESEVNLLIGSKKFSEGWSSWRVSTMGLMNVGRNEGSEIIQLFGRGVRLKGYEMSLKRSNQLTGVNVPRDIAVLETLNVFGVKADYMRQFKEYLEEEGLPPDKEPVEMALPVIKNLGKRKLKMMKIRDGVDFKKDGPRPVLDLPDRGILKNRVIINWYPRIQALDSGTKGAASSGELEEHKFNVGHVAFMDINEIYFELQYFKNERAWYNLNLDREKIQELLLNPDWYRLFIPAHQLEFNDFTRVHYWQEIAISLLKKYCERYYSAKKAEYERDKMEYIYVDEYEARQALDGKEGNIPEEYKFFINPSETAFIEQLKKLIDAVGRGELKDLSFAGMDAICIDQHLYKPLIALSNKEVKVIPVHLNKGEKNFVLDLKDYYEHNSKLFKDKELYLLRNQSRGKGIGFFEAGNFYPDFILWLVDGDKQYINFVDPKGLRNLDMMDDPKIRFYQTIKDLENQLGDTDVVLNSYIISVTPYARLNWRGDTTKAEFENCHVFFQEDRTEYIDKIFEKMY